MQSTLKPDDKAATDAPPLQKRRAALKWMLRAAIGILIVGAVLRGNPIAAVGPVLRRVSPLLFIGAVLVYEIGQLLSASRWRGLFNAMTAPKSDDGDESQATVLSPRAAAQIYFAAMFWNLWMPTGIGGDAFRALRSGEVQGGTATAAAAVLFDRVVGLVALVIVCAMGLVLDARGVASGASKVLWVAMDALLIIVAIAIALRGTLRRLALSSPTSFWSEKWRAFERIMLPFADVEGRKVLWSALRLSFAVQLLQIVINFALARAVGLDLPLQTFVWLGPSLALSSLLPLGVGGLGVREAAAVALLKSSGVPLATIVAWSLLWQATIWISSLPGALWAFRSARDE